jgi:ferredoxin-NADP reductase
MLDLLARALTHPREYAGILRSHQLTFVEQQHEGDSYYSFIFKPTEPMMWRAGQHGILFLPTSKRDRGWRPFSVASSPHEGVVRIGTMLPQPHSEFKAVLRTLTPGTTVTFRGPYGEFHAATTPEQIVGVAGGIGITPFRALAFDIAHQHLPQRKLHLIYATKDSYPYQAELEQWASQTDQLTIEYLREPAAVQEAIANQWNIYGNQARYFISGSPGMITGISQHCRTLGVRNVVNDPFKGY